MRRSLGRCGEGNGLGSIGLKWGCAEQAGNTCLGMRNLEGTHTLVEIVEKPCSDLLAHTTEVCKVSRGDELPA